jgi:membrane protease YdiL (CAAX protease family)
VDDISVTPDVNRLWSLGIFFFLSAALSWTVWLWPTGSHKQLLLSGFGFWLKIPSLAFFKLSIGSCLPGVLALVWTSCEGKEQFRQMVSTVKKWRTPVEWYAAAVALPLILFLAALSAVLFFFPTYGYAPSPFDFFLRFVTILPFGPLWEEIAWRAFALRKLESRYSRLVSALLLGVYWGVWHIPFWRVQLHSIPISLLLISIINVIALSVIFAYVYHCSSGSLPVVILFHAMYDACAPEVSLVVSRPDVRVRVVYALTVLSVCVAIASGMALGRKGRPQVDEQGGLR